MADENVSIKKEQPKSKQITVTFNTAATIKKNASLVEIVVDKKTSIDDAAAAAYEKI